ncbi:MAG: VOC family protein [Acidimicrobiia bacterium]|nr:VOC family protein [Acidimicrobiia bacterium]
MTIHVHAITLDATDAAALAGFWSTALGQPVDPDASPFFASINLTDESPGARRWMFIQVPEGKRAKSRMHVDFTADDREAEVERLVGLGATRVADFDEHGIRWTTLTDPEGNEFDIAAES